MLRVIGNLLSDQTVILQKTMDNRTHVINAYMYDDFLYAHIPLFFCEAYTCIRFHE